MTGRPAEAIPPGLSTSAEGRPTRGRRITTRAGTLRIALVTALAGGGAAACGLLPRAVPASRGIVLVFASGLEPGVDPERTPNLAGLAAAGRTFTQAFASSPDPAEARAAVLGSGARSLIDLFRQRAFRVAVWGASPPAGGIPDGLDVVRSDPDARAGLPAPAELESWLQRGGRFLALAFVGPPVLPPRVPAPDPGAHSPSVPRIAVQDLEFADRPGGTLHPFAWSMPSRERAQAAVLQRAIAADAALGPILAAIDRSAPDAAVVVVGDPPLDRGSHGVVRRAGLFDDTLRSTLVVRARGLYRPGRASEAPVSTAELPETLLALAGAGVLPGTAGRSLMPALSDPGAGGGDEVLSSTRRQAGRIGRTARSARWRFSEWPDGSRELYDHDADPAEITNLAARPEQRGVVEELGRALEPRPGPAAPAARADRPADRRNVLLVVVDDLNTRVGAWGAPVRTPNIDRLAARGVRFEHAYVAVAMCSPSRVSLMTGWRPERTGVWNNFDPPRPAGATPLQEHFAAHGYVTGSIGKIYHFPERFRWDVEEGHPQVVEDESSEAQAASGGLWSKASGGDLAQPDGQRALRAAELLGGWRRRHFFLAVGFVRPHLRWIAPARYFAFYPPAAVALTPYPPDDLADVPAIALKTRPQPLPGLPLLGREPPGLVRDPVLLRQEIAAYEACTTFVDAQVGVLLDALDRLDLWRSTIVALVGDNGFHLGEHGGFVRKDTLFEEGLHVPLIVVDPGRGHGEAVGAPVEVSDLYPTLVELAGLPPVDGLDARSLVPLLDEPTAHGLGPALSYRRVQPPERGWSLRTRRWRYTLWPDGSEELYDVRAATGALENLAGQPAHAADRQALRARLTALVAGGR